MKKYVIQSLQTEIVDVPIKRPHQFSVTKVSSKSFVILKMELNDGLIGIGEGTTPGIWWNGESVETMQLVIDQYLSPLITGKDPRDIEAILQLMDRHVRGNSFAKATVEMALYDLVGKIYDVPIYQLLGGKCREVLPVRWALASGSVDGDISEAEGLVEKNEYTNFKIKAGKEDPAADAERTVEIAKGLAGTTTIGVDPNGSWNRLVTKRWMEEFWESNVDFLEQPLPPEDYEGLSQLVAMKRVPVMVDESLGSLSDATRIIREGAADIFSLKIHKLGGLRNTKAVANIAEGAGIPCFGGTSLESSIGTAACLHVYSTVKNLDYGTELFGPDWLADDLVINPLKSMNGEMQVPEGPGLGVELDEEKVEKYRRR
ncbi:chloromuconate cycloisomerase [Halalkalibacillus sediminis]|uniref:Chloromuconate cycloisomerase n=1 Tax=Halalkalibacillus sediminis TaxID=2018042 RepID=A0A2I0QU75_9BACI|nr:muconate cycloisomerase family protein [Halalkalibacillus sediminis]PKR77854.1 chloromuconate cycloisomerase [Halalkalibacillus sediminis]